MLSPLELERWRALARYDSEIRSVAESLAAYGDEWEFEFARAFFALNEDRNYIGNIHRRLMAEAKLRRDLELEQERFEREFGWLAKFGVTSDGEQVAAESLEVLKKAAADGYCISISDKRVVAASVPGKKGETYLYNNYDIQRFGRLRGF